MEYLQTMPEDIINHIGAFYVTTQMKMLCRLSKIKNKVEELEKRSIDEWIEHIKFSKRYNIKITIIDNENIQYTNSFGGKYTLHKTNLLNQGYIAHIRNLHLWYTQRIISAATPAPQYEGEKITNILGKELTAKMIEYGEYDDVDESYAHRALVFTN